MTATSAVTSTAPAAECFTVRDDLIVENVRPAVTRAAS